MKITIRIKIKTAPACQTKPAVIRQFRNLDRDNRHGED